MKITWVGKLRETFRETVKRNILIYIIMRVDDIAYTVLYDADGNTLATIEGGYLDIGIVDTMKDLLVNFAGAVVFSICGYLYVYRRDTYQFAGNFIISEEPRMKKLQKQRK